MFEIIIAIFIISLIFFNNEHFIPRKCAPKFRRGIKFTNMKVCKRKCSSFVPEHLRNKNYCREKNGVAVCFPPDWIFS